MILAIGAPQVDCSRLLAASQINSVAGECSNHNDNGASRIIGVVLLAGVFVVLPRACLNLEKRLQETVRAGLVAKLRAKITIRQTAC